jgi:membrane associated rhomboid family serine protease
MFPYHDDNQTLRPALITLLFIALNVLVWFLVEGAGSPLAVARSVCDLGLIPGALTGVLRPGARFPLGEGLVCIIDPGSQISHVITSMFLHGSWAHLLGNMWFLWLFGNNVEDAMGRGRFVAFYLLSGMAAALAQVVANPASGIPMVGASGAISGVMGGYLVLYPTVRVFCFVPPLFFFALPAWTMLLYWLGLQFLGGLTGLASEEGGGVAFWAHAGGFVAGLVLVKFFARTDYVLAHRAGNWSPGRLRAG